MSASPPIRPYPFGPPNVLALHPSFAELRESEPVSLIQLPYGGEGWLVTRYEEVRSVISDPRFSRAAATGAEVPRMTPVPGGAASITMMDAPEHTRLRRLVAKAFSMRRIEELRPRVAARADRLLDVMASHGPQADLMARFAVPLGLVTISDMLGVPHDDHHRFQKWIDVITTTTAHSAQEVERALEDFASYLLELVERRRAEPSDDLLGALVHARDSEGRLSEQELITFIGTSFTGGQDNVAKQIGNIVCALLADRRRFDLVRQRPELVPGAVEEMLRYLVTGTGLSFARIATEDVELAGVIIREGEAVLVSFPAANRDPAAFAEPEAIDLTREHNPHLAFGPGFHHCLAASLVRMELQEAIGAITRRLPALRLAVPEEEIQWTTESITIGPVALPVTW